MLNPASVSANGAGFTLTVDGANFTANSQVLWNGQPRSTQLTPFGELAANIEASDIATTAELATALVTVQTPGVAPSNALVVSIVGAAVDNVQSQIVTPGTSATVFTSQSSGPAILAQVTADMMDTANLTVTAATYGSNPTGSQTSFDVGGGFVDLRVSGAGSSDSMVSSFYYPASITGDTETALQLLYWDGSNWAPVRSSGGTDPTKDITDGLDGIPSGGRFTVTFDATSTPPITALGGTVMLMGASADHTPPVVTVQGVADGDKYVLGTPVGPTCSATDAGSGLAGPCGLTLAGPGTANGVGQYRYTATATDKAGNTATVTGSYWVIYGFDGFLQPINDTEHPQTCGTPCPVSIFKGGSTVPVKFQLKDVSGNVVQAGTPPAWLAPQQGGPTQAPVDESTYSDPASSAQSYAWDGSQYHYNWSTKGSAVGYYWQIGVNLDDGQSYVVDIGLR